MKKLLALSSAFATFLFTLSAFAQDSAAASNAFDAQSASAIGAGLAIGLAALGGGLGQGKTASAGLEGMARNPQAAGSLLTPMILGLAFTESLVLFGFVIAYLQK